MDDEQTIEFLRMTIAKCDESISDLDEMLDCRAGKLLRKNKRFIVVAVDEPYFMQVYEMIRGYEQAKGEWTPTCEVRFYEAEREWVKYNA